MRWNLVNLLCICAGCHFFAHQNPLEFSEWVRALLGEDDYQELRRLAKSNDKLSLTEMQELLKTYQGRVIFDV